MGIYPGLKSEFLGPKTLKKTFTYASSTPDKWPRKKIDSMIYPGSSGKPKFGWRKFFPKLLGGFFFEEVGWPYGLKLKLL